MIMPIPPLSEPCVAFHAANAFYGDHLDVQEEAEIIEPIYSAEPFVLIGYDGQAWRVRDTLGPPIMPRTLFEKVVAWIVGGEPSPSLVAREVTPVAYSVEEFKREVCRRIPGYPNAVLGDETLAGAGLPKGVDIEVIGAALVAWAQAKVVAADSIAGVIDALLEAQAEAYDQAQALAHAQLSAP